MGNLSRRAFVASCLAVLAAPRAARADLVVDLPDLLLRGHDAVVTAAPTEASFTVRNTGRRPEALTDPRLVVLDDGVRLPVRLERWEVDGRAHGRFETHTLAPGASAELRFVFAPPSDRGQPAWRLELTLGGVRGTVTLRRR